MSAATEQVPLAAAQPPRPSPVATENAKAAKDVMQKTMEELAKCVIFKMEIWKA